MKPYKLPIRTWPIIKSIFLASSFIVGIKILIDLLTNGTNYILQRWLVELGLFAMSFLLLTLTIFGGLYLNTKNK